MSIRLERPKRLSIRLRRPAGIRKAEAPRNALTHADMSSVAREEKGERHDLRQIALRKSGGLYRVFTRDVKITARTRMESGPYSLADTSPSIASGLSLGA